MKKILVALMTLATLASCSSRDKVSMAGGGREEDIYFKLTVDGVQRELPNIHYAREGKTVHLATWGEDGFPNLHVTMTATAEDDFRGDYDYFWDISAGTAIVLYSIESGGYESHWWDCPADKPLFMPSPGKVIIEKIERTSKGEFITGRFDVEQYRPMGNCPHAEVKTIKISARFRLKKA